MLSNKSVIFSYENAPINWLFNQYWGYWWPGALAWIIIPFCDTKRTMEYTQHDDPFSLVSYKGIGQLENLFI